MVTIQKIISLQDSLNRILDGNGWSVIILNGVIRITYVSGKYVSTLDIKDESDYEYNSLGRKLSISKFLDKLERSLKYD